MKTGKGERKRLLVLTSTFPRWKDDSEPPFVYELCLYLIKNYDIHVLAPHCLGAARKEQLSGIKVTRFRYFFTPWQSLAYQGGILSNLKQNPWRYGLVPFFMLAELFALVRLLRCHRFDLIHAHWVLPQGLVVSIERLFVKSATPSLCTAHGGDLYGLQGILFRWVKRLILSHVTAMTVVSNAMCDAVIELGADPGRVHVIPMGVDLRHRFVPPTKRPDDGSLLFVGRLVEKKGLRYLIDALPMVLEKHPYVMLRIIGDGPEKKVLTKQVTDLGINDHVRFIGALEKEHLPAWYQASDILIFPSVIAEGGDREGFGLVLVEALGCECAAVTTDLPEMQDIIIDGKTGLVVQQKNIQQLADKIICLLDDPALRRSLGKKGRRFVLERYDWEKISRLYSELIESIA